MRRITGLSLVLVSFVPAVLSAGQIYGTIVSSGGPLKAAGVQIQCGSEAATGSTAADGSYRINVPQQGQCTLALPSYQGRPSVTIFSSPNPSVYNFELTKLADGKYELRRR
jgi:hypothetical protein